MSLLEADNFKDDWLGWITNQGTHALVGLVAFITVMAASFILHGEFAYRYVVLISITLCYLGFEFIIQRGKHFWDSIEDTIFTCGYGVGIPALVFVEVEVGSAMFSGNINTLLPLVGFLVFHACLGVLVRNWNW